MFSLRFHFVITAVAVAATGPVAADFLYPQPTLPCWSNPLA